MADVFISYKREERSQVAQLADALRALNLSVWFDASLSAGEAFSDEIDREARAAKSILVCWSPTARESRWVKAEAEIGFTQDKLAAAYVAGPDGFAAPVPFNTIHEEDLRAWLASPHDTHSGWRSLLRRVGRLCGRKDIESWGGLDAQASAAQLRAWIKAHSDSPLFIIVESMLRDREIQDAERTRLEQEALERRAREEAERREQEKRERRGRDAERARREQAERERRAGDSNAVDFDHSGAGPSKRGGSMWMFGIILVVAAVAAIWIAPRILQQATTGRVPADNVEITGSPLRFATVPVEGIVYAGQSARASLAGVAWTVALSENSLRTTHPDGWSTERGFDNLHTPESCSLTPAAEYFLVICRDLDQGPVFVSFLEPGSSHSLANLLNPMGNGFHLPLGCAPPRDHTLVANDECYAPLGDSGILVMVAWCGEIGTNLLAIDVNRHRVIWPSRTSAVEGFGPLRTVASQHPQFPFYQIDNIYRRADMPDASFVATAHPVTFGIGGGAYEVRGNVRLESESTTLESPVAWYFDRPQ